MLSEFQIVKHISPPSVSLSLYWDKECMGKDGLMQLDQKIVEIDHAHKIILNSSDQKAMELDTRRSVIVHTLSA